MTDSDLTIWREPMREEWIDYNGHLSEPYYILVMGNGTEALIDAIGLDPAYRRATGSTVYTLESHARFLAEVRSSRELEVRSSVIGCTAKLAWLWHELWADGRLRATAEVLVVHITDGSSSPFPDEIANRLRGRIVDAPAEAGRRINITTTNRKRASNE